MYVHYIVFIKNYNLRYLYLKQKIIIICTFFRVFFNTKNSGRERGRSCDNSMYYLREVHSCSQT